MPGNRLAGSRVRRLRHSRVTFLSCFPADGGNPYLLFVRFAATSAGSPARKRTENSPVNGQPDGFIRDVSRGTRPDSVDRELPRECARSYMRIGKILGLETRFVTTAIIGPARWREGGGRRRRRLVTVLIVSSTCCYRAEWPAIARTIGRRLKVACFVPGALSGRFA